MTTLYVLANYYLREYTVRDREIEWKKEREKKKWIERAREEDKRTLSDKEMNNEEWSEGWMRIWEKVFALDVLHKFRIEIRETHKFRLVQVHHEQLIRGSQVCLFRRKLLVEVANVLTMLLKHTKKKDKQSFICIYAHALLRNKKLFIKIKYSRSLVWRVAAPRDFLSFPNRYAGRTREFARLLHRAIRILIFCLGFSWGTAMNFEWAQKTRALSNAHTWNFFHDISEILTRVGVWKEAHTYCFTNFFSLFWQTLWITDIMICNRGEEFILVLPVERRLTY